jgi:hypothetical protein
VGPPMVVMYLYVHEPGEGFSYPTARAAQSSAAVAIRYLECALTQAASLRLQDAQCDIALVTNVEYRDVLGRTGNKLVDAMERLEVTMLTTAYRHRPAAGTEIYVSSRFVFDAVLAAAEGQPSARQLWLTDLDCVWADPDKVFASAPVPPEIGCIYIGYGPDWDTVGFGADGLTRNAIGEIAGGMGGPAGPPPWVGGELLVGTVESLCELVEVVEKLDSELAAEHKTLPNEEQILTLAGALGPGTFRDLSHVVRRMPTGARNVSAKVADPLSIGLWHLPAEKGLSLRRSAREVAGGHETRMRRDLRDPRRAARRFNVAGAGPIRRIQDDSWIAAQRIRHMAASALKKT